ncbi:MAG TPA: transglycosylase domain-containing protein [Acidobacteriaceae bacterium]|nr:transglycosylase domain-containing protein [Acidobacteriaceae bacterium]
MPVKVKVPRKLVVITGRKILLVAAMVCTVAILLGCMVFATYWTKYGQVVDDRLKHPLFVQTASIFAAPPEVRPGQELTAKEVVAELEQADYTVQGQGTASKMGTYSASANSVTVHPGPQSYHSQDGATISFAKGQVTEVTGDNGQQLAAYELEPLLVTGLSDANRAKRRIVTWDDIPKNLVSAVTAIEDRRFFQHGGLDYWGILRSFVNDYLHPGHRYREGASTLDMQLAKMFFLSPERTWHRKFLQVIITLQLEHRFNKQQIFQMYANEVPLGQHGSFAIEGFGEAAQAYFGKDITQLTLPECATLAGIIQSPSRLNPYTHRQRALERRNLVLDSMVDTGDITKAQAEQAKAAPLGVVVGAIDAGEAPYFVDLVRDQLTQRLGDSDYNEQGLRIYTSLDPQLQQVAQDAVNEGMQTVDKLVTAHFARLARIAERKGQAPPKPIYPQVALIALNPHTGQVLALVGGRNYGISQFNHAVSHRPTGSIFKPFVYAAAFNTALAGTPLTNTNGTSAVFTPVTVLHDQQTSFTYGDNQVYTPKNFQSEYFGDVSATEALYRSLNNATISLAEMVGLDNVASLAKAAGITSVEATPAMAIGSYDATPMQMAGAYTVFANGGIKIDPWMLASVRAPNGDVIADYAPQTKPVLDPRAAFLTVSMMEQVLNNPHGSGAGVRNMGFRSPAAGKTGTSHDAWFAGFTSNLLCVVWVGNDDYSDIKIEGAHAAGPVWADFMKNAVKLPQYSDTKDFVPPPGVVQVQLDRTTNLLADAACPEDYTAAFLDGTQPTDTCDHSIGDQRNIFQKIFGLGQRPAAQGPQPPRVAQQPAAPQQQQTQTVPVQPAQAQNQPADQDQDQKKKKHGFWSKLFGKKDDKQQDQNNPQQ